MSFFKNPGTIGTGVCRWPGRFGPPGLKLEPERPDVHRVARLSLWNGEELRNWQTGWDVPVGSAPTTASS